MKLSNVQSEMRIAILYAIFGGLWILLSDSLLAPDALTTDYALYAKIQTYKGWFFVATSAILIFYLIKHEIAKQIETAVKLRATEEALRRFELLSEHSRDIILFMRREDGRILEANAAAMQAYGYSRDELLALTVQDLRARNTQDLTADQMAQADAGGILFETVHLRKDGSTFPVEVSSQGATIGGLRTLVSIVRNITERKQAEHEIASISKFPTENPNPVLRVQIDGKVIYANESSQELLEFWGCETDDYLPAEMKDLITQTVNSGLDKTMDVPCNNVVYSIMIVPVLDAGYVNLYGRDITAHKQAEETLRKKEAEIRSLYESMTELFVLHEVIYDATGKALDYRLLECNPAYEKITGIPRNLAVGSLASKVYGTKEAPYLDIYATVAETGKPVDFETEFFPLGKQFHISVFSPEKGHFATLASDITERKQAEEELNRTLEELKSSNAELEQFAYVASHDLQEPLRGIAGLAQLLQQRYQGQLDSQADEFINLIVDGTQRMQTLINDLLAYSRIGRRGEAIRSTEAEAALKAVMKNLSVGIREYGATITNDSLPTVKADATQLIQLFQNLIANAIKFRTERPPRIHIGVSDAGRLLAILRT
jgi:PAS domain S-box-containing protein